MVELMKEDNDKLN